jgi:hypothetical protein
MQGEGRLWCGAFLLPINRLILLMKNPATECRLIMP